MPSFYFFSVAKMEVLSRISGRAVAHILRQQPEKMSWIVSFLPFTLQLCILVHFTNAQFVGYLKCFSKMGDIAKKSNDREFQLFLINFLQRLDLDDQHESYFQTRKMDLQFDLLHDLCDLNEHSNQYMNQCHFASQSLGFTELLYKVYGGNATFEYYMFVRKFNIKLYSIVYPPTVMPLSLAGFVSDKKMLKETLSDYFMFPAKLPTMREKKMKPHPSETFSTVKERFCLRMIHLWSLFCTEKYHECLYKCMELLENFKEHHIHYKMYIWGCLSVILTFFNCSDLSIQSCLHQVKINLLFESDSFDYYFFQQQIFHLKNNVKQEKNMFESIFNHLPKTSRFVSIALKLHLKTQLHNMENLFCEIMCFKKKRIVHRRLDGEEIELRKNIILKDAKRLKKLIYKVFSLGELENYKKLHIYLYIINFYASVAKENGFDFMADDYSVELKALENIQYSFHFLAQLLNSENFNYTVAQYIDNMNELKENLERQTHNRSSKKWADVCFTHFIFLAMHNQHDAITNQLKSDAFLFYDKINHYRAVLLKDFNTCEHTTHLDFLSTSYFQDLSSEVYFHVSMPLLLQMESKLKHILYAGMKSLKLYNKYSF